MADIAASNWSETDGSNNTASPDGFPEGMAPSGVNDSTRAMMGAIKRWYDWTIPKTTAGTSTAYTLTYTVAPGALVDGMTHLVQFNAVNGASPTLNVNTLGAKPLHFYCGGSWAVLPANAIAINQVVEVTYNSSAGTYRCIGLPLVLTQSVSAVSVVDFTAIPSNVNHLQIYFEFRPSVDGAQFELQTYGADGVLDTGASDYYALNINYNTGSSTATVTAGTTSFVSLTSAAVDNSTTGVGGDITASNIQAATFTKFNYRLNYLDSAGALGAAIVGNGARVEADRITGVRLTVASGTFTGRATLVALS